MGSQTASGIAVWTLGSIDFWDLLGDAFGLFWVGVAIFGVITMGWRLLTGKPLDDRPAALKALEKGRLDAQQRFWDNFPVAKSTVTSALRSPDPANPVSIELNYHPYARDNANNLWPVLKAQYVGTGIDRDRPLVPGSIKVVVCSVPPEFTETVRRSLPEGGLNELAEWIQKVPERSPAWRRQSRSFFVDVDVTRPDSVTTNEYPTMSPII